MSDLNPGKTFQHLVIAALAGALIVFVVKAGADRALPKPKAVVAVAVQSAPASAQSAAADEQEAVLQEAERQATLAKQERLQKEREQSTVDQAKREQNYKTPWPHAKS